MCQTNLPQKSRILGLHYRKTLKDRNLKISVSPRYVLKAKTAKFQGEIRLGRWFSRYPILKVLTNMYNSAGPFSNVWKLFSRSTFFDFLSNRRLRLLFEGVGGLRPPPPGGFAPGRRRGYWSPGRACQRCNYEVISRRDKLVRYNRHASWTWRVSFLLTSPTTLSTDVSNDLKSINS